MARFLPRFIRAVIQQYQAGATLRDELTQLRNELDYSKRRIGSLLAQNAKLDNENLALRIGLMRALK